MTRKPARPRTSTQSRPRKAPPAAAAAPGKDDSGSGKGAGTSGWEWILAGVGALILAGVVGFLVYEGLSSPNGAKPAIVVAGEAPVKLPTGMFLVPIRVVNEGKVTGANVTVRGELRGADGMVVEESATTFDFVAQHSAESGGLYFTSDPATLDLGLRVEGYTDP